MSVHGWETSKVPAVSGVRETGRHELQRTVMNASQWFDPASRAALAAIDRDLGRDVWCVLGLPVDRTTVPAAAAAIRRAAAAREQLVLSTPNLNFVREAWRNPGFRDTVLDCDLSLADGMPLVWDARLSGVPLPGRVPGSGLIEQLRRETGHPPLATYLFGGQPGTARRACERLGEENGGLVPVGSRFPGFGSVEEMSESSLIGSINASAPDLLLVAVSAVKGQRWIQRNRSRLDAAVIMQVGATVNFIAGTVRRAPVWMQRTGLEWLWRMRQEPALWHRYRADGMHFLRCLAMGTVPLGTSRAMHRRRERRARLEVESHQLSGEYIVQLLGDAVDATIPVARPAFHDALAGSGSLKVDMSGVHTLDPAFVGHLMLVWKHARRQDRTCMLKGVSSAAGRQLRWMYADFLLE